MSKFTISALTAAVVLAVSGNALANGAVTKPGVAQDYIFAHNVTGGTSTNPLATTANVAFSVSAPDILIGRHSGTGQITVEAVIVGAKLGAALADTDITKQGDASVNTVSATVGQSAFQFTMTPPTGAGFVATSPLFTIDNIVLQDATGLASLDGNVTIAFTIKDTTTGTVLSSAAATAVLTSKEATATVHTPGGDNTVDVLASSAKKQFLVGAANQAFVTLGTVAVSQADFDSVAANAQAASALGTAATANVDAAGDFVFAAADTIKLSLSVPQPAAFIGAGKGFYATQGACAATYTAAATTVGFSQDANDATKFTATVPVSAATGATYTICAIVNGTTVIDAQTIGLTSQVDLAGSLTKDPAAKTTAAFNVLKYNGAVKNVWHFNPASNADQVSYLRLTNTSATSGLVTIDAICDDGTPTPSSAKLTLVNGKSVLLTSKDVEQGNAGKGVTQGTGACAAGGKVRLTITGEFGSMEVQNFLRNNTSAGTVNTNVNNKD